MRPKERICMAMCTHSVESYTDSLDPIFMVRKRAPYDGIWRDCFSFWYFIIMMFM